MPHTNKQQKLPKKANKNHPIYLSIYIYIHRILPYLYKYASKHHTTPNPRKHQTIGAPFLNFPLPFRRPLLRQVVGLRGVVLEVEELLLDLDVANLWIHTTKKMSKEY